MARSWKVCDKVVVDTGRHTVDGVIEHVSTVEGNPAPYVVRFRLEDGSSRTRNCAAKDLSPR